MKNVILILFVFFAIGNSYSQKYDFNWIFGYDFSNNPKDTVEGINFLEFNTTSGNPIVTYNPYIKSDFHNYGCLISDINGRFLFSFDGYNVEDYKYNYIPNSRQVCPDGDCEYLMQGSTIIPKPGKDSAYYLFNEQDDIVSLDSTVLIFANLFNYNELLELPNKQGIRLKIIRKILLNDTLDVGKVAYCKHANGRDWWILVPGRFNNKFYTFLIDNNKINFVKTQEVGKERNFGSGFSCFSPNGEYYVIATKDDRDEWS
ncbi:MAG: hypothetical protein M3Q56_10075, partial [Bacteroidota bacterium]|nr:hypothetical protein [Bacteroidota bacterium]